MKKVYKPLRLKATSFLFLRDTLIFIIAILLSLGLWHFVTEQKLEQINQKAQQSLILYSSKIERELGYSHQSLLPVVATHPDLLNYFSAKKNVQYFADKAKQQLVFLHHAFDNKTVFVGNAQQFLLESVNKPAERKLIASVKKLLVNRSYKGQTTTQLIFTPDEGAAKLLIAIPVKTQQQIVGYIGMLLDLSLLQAQLETSLVSADKVVIISDERGIILLSSQKDWLFQSFSNLPYSLKKSIHKRFEAKKLFTQLGSINVDAGILTTTNKNDNDQDYLVHSLPLQGYPLRIHYLANIAEVEKQSLLSIALLWLFLALLALMLLFLKTKRLIQVEKLSLEDTLQERNSEFKHQQKLASLGMMATTIAHEINQPITAIKTEAKIGSKYSQRGDSKETEKSFISIIEYTQLLAMITEQLKNFARKRKSSSSNVANIKDSIMQSISLNGSRLKSDRVSYTINDIDANLYGKIDVHQLQQVLSNLIQNACDAMQLCVEKQLTISVKAMANSLVIEVTDTGVGIDEDKQKSMFDAFVSNKNNTSSMGLGLAICQDILSHVGGGITVISPADVEKIKGTSFFIHLLTQKIKNTTSQK
ncbi:MAG: ATP-binding protein [Colwellia sp.]